MHQFKDFGIKAPEKGFKGEKIKIDKILNREIIVEDFKVEKSKFEGKGECLHLQIIYNNINWVVFTGSQNLIEMIRKVKRESLPFKTTIVKEEQRLDST